MESRTEGSCLSIYPSVSHPSAGMTTPDGPHQMSRRITELPMELHICIQYQLLTDPEVTLEQLRPLRLVCKTFDGLWSPVVATNMALFKTDATSDSLAQLRYLIHGTSDVSTLARTGYTTITIQNMCCVDTILDRWYSDARRLCKQGIIAILKETTLALLWLSVMFICSLYYLLTNPTEALLGIILLVALPIQFIVYFIKTIPKFRARYYMALLPKNLNMPSIRRVKLLFGHNESDWAIHRATKILLFLPHLTELELGSAGTIDLEYLVRCLAPVNGLRRLTLLPTMIAEPQLHCIATLILNNENLTHFDWQLATSPDFSVLFGAVPTDRPLKLHHVSLGRGCSEFDRLIPHIRSLASFEFRSNESNRWCIPFSRTKIYPSSIMVHLLDQELITFIKDHPGIVRLRISSSSIAQGTGTGESSLCKALTHHSETLLYLSIQSKLLVFLLSSVENEADFLRFGANLRELVLETEETLLQYQCPTKFGIMNERRILRLVAHLSRTLILVIRAWDKEIFSSSVAFCRKSENPLIRDLAGRIVYERPCR